MDQFKNITLPYLKHFGVTEGIEIKILKRSFQDANGKVRLLIPNVRKLLNIELLEEGFVSRVRGTLYSNKVNTRMHNTIINNCRRVFNNFIPDV